MKVPPDHPRAESLHIREKLVENHQTNVVATAGLIAHGRGEAFDYLLGEKTTEPALKAIRAAASSLILAAKPVISVNGNVAALVSKDIVQLAQVADAKIEINLFYRSIKRETAIKNLLKKSGAKEVLGVGENASSKIPELGSERRRVDPRGILTADVVFVPLEDGDRTEALIEMGKKVITIDLNPLSRTAQKATITIVDNVVRATPRLIETVRELKTNTIKAHEVLQRFDNSRNIANSISMIKKRLSKIAEENK
ncbi:MAG: 4-phosphopantoate--beta-alanine ligase [Candidatus Bathyarchaeota archaeon]